MKKAWLILFLGWVQALPFNSFEVLQPVPRDGAYLQKVMDRLKSMADGREAWKENDASLTAEKIPKSLVINGMNSILNSKPQSLPGGLRRARLKKMREACSLMRTQPRAYWNSTVGSIPIKFDENETHAVRWYTNVDSFPRQLQMFSCAIEYAHRTDRLLILPPLFSFHDRFTRHGVDAVHMNDIIELPQQLEDVRIKQVPYSFGTRCDSKFNGFTHYLQHGENALFPSAERDGNKGVGHDLTFDEIVAENSNAFSNVCITSAPLHNCAASVPLASAPRYRRTFLTIRDSLFGVNASYDAVHWCARDLCDETDECGSPEIWIPHLIKRKEQIAPVYVSTMVTNATQLGLIKSRGYYLLEDTARTLHTDLDILMFEFDILIHAKNAFIVQNKGGHGIVLSIVRLVNTARKALGSHPMVILSGVS